MGDVIKIIQQWIYRYMVWLLIIASILVFTFSKIDVFTPVVEGYLEKISFAILSSGVFAAVLKSIQFTGLFKDEIEKVITGTKFIQNRRDLPQLWSEISKTIYKRKFPQISEELESRILESYFPTDHTFYYADFIITIKIEEINADFEISYTQTLKYNVVLDKNVDEVEITYTSSIDQNGDGARIKNELEFLCVDGKDMKPEEENITAGDPKNSIHKIKLKGKGPFKIHSKYNRRYSLKDENYKLFRTSRFVKNMAVVINYPEDIRVSFFNIGLVNKFEKQHVELENQISRSHKNDVILPHQGFGMSFEKIS